MPSQIALHIVQELPPLEGMPRLPPFSVQNNTVPLFDLVYDNVNPVKALVPDYDYQIFKLERDTKNPARLMNNRHMGMFRCVLCVLVVRTVDSADPVRYMKYAFRSMMLKNVQWVFPQNDNNP